MQAGIAVALLSGRDSPAVAARAAELGIAHAAAGNRGQAGRVRGAARAARRARGRRRIHGRRRGRPAGAAALRLRVRTGAGRTSWCCANAHYVTRARGRRRRGARSLRARCCARRAGWTPPSPATSREAVRPTRAVPAAADAGAGGAHASGSSARCATRKARTPRCGGMIRTTSWTTCCTRATTRRVRSNPRSRRRK